jgi:hypothetical protein
MCPLDIGLEIAGHKRHLWLHLIAHESQKNVSGPKKSTNILILNVYFLILLVCTRLCRAFGDISSRHDIDNPHQCSQNEV